MPTCIGRRPDSCGRFLLQGEWCGLCFWGRGLAVKREDRIADAAANR